ncbi:MAG: hypothetical protein WD749_06985 [Phycisphaerales bacterium]
MDGPAAMTPATIPAPPPPGGPRRAPLSDSQRTFQYALGRATARTGATPREQAREAAEQFVAQTFIQPLLNQLRRMEQAAPPFAPGPGEKQFRALMDADLAHRLTAASSFPLVDRVAQQMLAKGGPRATEARATGYSAALTPLFATDARSAAQPVLFEETHPRVR